MGLTIEQSYAQIRIERTPGELQIRTQGAVLELRQKHADMSMKSEKIMVLIDQSEAFASMGYKNHLQIAKEAAQLGIRRVLEYIATTAEDGDRLAAIEQGGTPLADIAERNAFPEKEFSGSSALLQGPRFEVTGGTLEIHPHVPVKKVEGTYHPAKLRYRYRPSRINIYLGRKAAIKFKYTEN